MAISMTVPDSLSLTDAMTTRFFLSSILLALACANARADDWPYEAECRKFANIAIPKDDIGTAPAKCDSNVLYYGSDGSGKSTDFRAARACAYRERAEKFDGQFGGAAILMMVYANGLGVPRNVLLAKRFACEVEGAPAEVEGRLQSLDGIARGLARKNPFDLCDDVTSGLMMGFCSDHSASFDRAKRQRRYEAMQSAWTPMQREAFSKLRKAAGAYFDASSSEEIDMSGTMRGMLSVMSSESLETDFLAAIERFERGVAPHPGAVALRAEDGALNAAYRAALRESASDGPERASSPGSVTANGLRDTQRRWLAYREAWVDFGAARYPSVPADAWRAWLSHERTQRIRNPEPDMEDPASH